MDALTPTYWQQTQHSILGIIQDSHIHKDTGLRSTRDVTGSCALAMGPQGDLEFFMPIFQAQYWNRICYGMSIGTTCNFLSY